MKWQSKACKISAKQLIFGFNESRKKILVPKKFAKNFADSLFIYFAFFKELYAKYILLPIYNMTLWVESCDQKYILV